MRKLFLIVVTTFCWHPAIALDLAKLAETYSQLEVAMSDSAKGESLPKYSLSDRNQEVRLWEQIRDAHQQLLNHSYESHNESLGILGFCSRANTAYQTYLYHGAQAFIEEGSASMENPEFVEKVSENMESYQNEMTEFMSFAMECFGVLMSPLQTFWNSLPADQKTDVRKNAVVGLRQDIQQIHQGVFLLLSGQIFSSDNKDVLLNSVLEAAPKLKIMFSLEAREKMVSFLEQYENVLANKFVKPIQLAKEIYSDTDCHSLCQL